MTNRTSILNELEGIAPVLIHLPFTMPYTVPQAYFEQLPADVLIALGLDETYAFAPETAQILKENVYQVPDDYFEGLADILLDRVTRADKEDTVPTGYFESLPGILIDKIRALEVTTELEELAPVLNTISKKPVSFVPQDYFENLEPVLAESAPAQAKVVSMGQRRGWLKYAVAACLTGAIAFTTFSIMNRSKGTGGDERVVNVTEELSKIDDSTIQNYLTKEELGSDAKAIAYQDVKVDDIKDFLKEFSDDELQQYLQNEGESTGNN